MPKIDIENPRMGFARIKIEVDGKEILCKSVSYGDSMERGNVEGNARMSLGVTDGMYKADECELELYMAEYAELIDAFGEKFYTKNFDVSIAFEKSGDGGSGNANEGKLTKDELVGCRFTKRAAQDQSGTDGLTRRLTCQPTYVKFNGKNPLPTMPQGAK